MKILAFDTSTKFLSVACLEDVMERAVYHEDVGLRHSEIFIPVIGETLAKAGWKIKDIDLICVSLGPGSFTGLRISVTTAKALAFVTGCKVIGVPTMDAMVRRFPGNGVISPLMDARKGKVYTCTYRKESGKVTRLTEYLLVAGTELFSGLKEKVVFFGDGVGIYDAEINSTPFAEAMRDIDWYPRAIDIGRIGLEMSSRGTADIEDLEPLYLHAKECNVVLKKN